MTLTLSEDLVQATRLSKQQILRELAVALFQGGHLTLPQAAGLAETDRLTFQHVLASRGIPLHYGEAGCEEDLRTLSKLADG
jgi:predicted HTH domain antitoxin